MKTLLHAQPARLIPAAGQPAAGAAFGPRFVILLLVLSSMGGLFTSATPGAVQADELDDAYARQARLQKLIDKQKESIKNLTANQAVLATRISSTKSTLAQLNANLLTTKTQIVGDDRRHRAVAERGRRARRHGRGPRGRARPARGRGRSQGQPTSPRRRRSSPRASGEAYDTDRTPLLDDVPLGRRLHRRAHRGRLPARLRRAGQAARRPDRPGPEGARRPARRTSSARAPRPRSCEELAAQARKVLDRQLAELRSAQKELLRLERRDPEAPRGAEGRLRADGPPTRPSSQQKLARGPRGRGEAREAHQQARPRDVRGRRHSRRSTTASSSGRCRARSRRSSAAPASAWSRRSATATTSTAASTSPTTPARRSGPPAPGKVILAGRSPYDPAYIVVIAHSAHLVTWYGHLDRPTSGQGRPVRRQGPRHRLRGLHRLVHRPAPPLGRPAGRDLGEPAPLPAALDDVHRPLNGS